MILPGILMQLGSGFSQSVTYAMSHISSDGGPAALAQAAMFEFQPIAGPLTALLSTIVVAALVANFAQVGFVLSGEMLSPSLNRLNPAQGIKRLFGFRSAFEGIKAAIKSFIFGYIAYQAIQSNLTRLYALTWLRIGPGLATIGEVAQTVLSRIIIAWIVLAAVDYFVQKKQVDKQLMMTKEELKQEAKESEQSPELRAAIAQRRRRLKRRMMQAIKTADAIVTNPTHFAVAIRYEKGKDHAPVVVAKGVDLLAARIREEAAKHRVPVVPNPPLARALYRLCEVGDNVPRELFQPVAEVLAYVYKTLKRIRK